MGTFSVIIEFKRSQEANNLFKKYSVGKTTATPEHIFHPAKTTCDFKLPSGVLWERTGIYRRKFYICIPGVEYMNIKLEN